MLMKSAVPWIATVVTGVLLRLSYAPWHEASMAWFAFVPLLVAVRGAASWKRAFGLGMAGGGVFWLSSLAWFWRLIENGGPWPLVALGFVGLSAYCAFYTAVFCIIAWRILVGADLCVRPDGQGAHTGAPLRNVRWWGAVKDLGAAVAGTVAWVGLEWVRATFLTGFAWNHLGVSQVTNTAVIQVASLGGVYAVSAVVIFVNLVLAGFFRRMWHSVTGRHVSRWNVDVFAALCVLAAVLVWGRNEINRWDRHAAESAYLTVAGVQADTPSIFEKTDDSAHAALERFAERTDFFAVLSPDIVIWPETVGNAWDPAMMGTAFAQAKRAGCPLLVGMLDAGGTNAWSRRVEDTMPNIELANASLLIGTNRTIAARYWKQHLVPFGEFIPGDRLFPILERLAPVGFSCEFGRSNVLMRVKGVALSPLICFEDTVSGLARRAVREGAQLLVNQSNDAWFANSSEGRQHHDQAVFRAVENRTPLVRVSNTGVSGIIDPVGRFGDNSAYFCAPVAARAHDWPLSPYTRYGDWLFAIPCALLTALWHIISSCASKVTSR
ncbi:MAG: apolipoprotein N-acyltransferase [Kiritimatiellaeota bacterium]|nr:apolipoprotein N-acyltransferase [Kiritimatiellota bacterium]